MPTTPTQDAPEVLFSYQPESDFTRTAGWLLIAIPLMLAGLSLLDYWRNPSGRLLAINLLIGIGGAAGMYAVSKVVDRAQENCRLEVLDDGTLRWRNMLGRMRELPLSDATDFEIKDFRKKPSIIHRNEVVPQRPLLSTAPHLTQIRVRYRTKRRHNITMTGTLSQEDRRKLNDAVERVKPNLV